MSSHKCYDKHNRDQEAKRFYNSNAWLVCRTTALARDNYLCQECLKQDKIKKYDVVHHIKPRDKYPWLAFRLDNLICLCHKCHNSIHSDKGRQNRNKNKKGVVKFKANEELG